MYVLIILYLIAIFCIAGGHNTFEDHAGMEDALEYFCPLSDTQQEEFIACPQLSLEAVNYFSLAKAIDCTSKEDLAEYTSSCDFVCLGIKAAAIEGYKETEAASDALYDAEIAELDEEINWQTQTAEALTALAEVASEVKETWSASDPDAFQQKFVDKIDSSTTLSEDKKTELKEYVASKMTEATEEGSSTFNEMEADFMTEIATAKSAADSATASKTTATNKKSTVKSLGTSLKT